MDIIAEFKKFIENYYSNLMKTARRDRNVERSRDILYMLFGIDRTDRLNQSEIAMVLGLERARISKIALTEIKGIQLAILGGRSDTEGFSDPEFFEETRCLKNELLPLKLLSKKQINKLIRDRYQINFDIDNGWERFYFQILGIDIPEAGIKLVSFDEKTIPYKKAKETRDEIIAFLKKAVVPCTVENIILDIARKHRSTQVRPNVIVNIVINALEEVEFLEDETGRKLYQIKFNELSSVADYAYRVLSTRKEPLHYTEILSDINSQLLKLGENRLDNIRTLTNQMVQDKQKRFKAVGKDGTWTLASDSTKTGAVWELMVDEFIRAGHPLSADELYNRLQEKRKVNRNSMITYLADKRDVFLKIVGDKYILNDWKRKYSNDIVRERRNRVENSDALLIKLFKESPKKSLCLNEIKILAKDYCQNEVTLRSWLNSNIFDVEKVGKRNYWSLKDSIEDEITKPKSKSELMLEQAIAILKSKNDLVFLRDLKTQIEKSGFNGTHLYQVIDKNPGIFIKEKIDNKITVRLVDYGSKSQDLGSLVKQIANLQTDVKSVSEKIDNFDGKLENVNEEVRRMRELLPEIQLIKENTIHNPEDADEINLYAQKLKNLISDTINTNNAPEIATYGRNDYQNFMWKKVSDETREYLIVGDQLLKIIGSAGVDLAPVCICYCRAVELELNHRLLRVVQLEIPNMIIDERKKITVENSKSMMIGDFFYVLSKFSFKFNRAFVSKGIRLEEFIKKLNDIREIRNKVTHQGKITTEIAHEFRRLIFGTESSISFLSDLQKFA